MPVATSRPRRLHAGILAALVLLVSAAVSARTGDVTITSISIDRVMLGARITIEAGGPLPAPDVGVLDSPPRIFLDLRGVRTTTRRVPAQQDDPFVRQVRAALNSAAPAVTRIVIDLVGPAPHVLNAGARAQGRLTITVGPIAAPGAASQESTPISTAPTPARAAPASSPVPPPAPAPHPSTSPVASTPPTWLPKQPDVHLPPEDVQRYRRDAAGALARIDAFRGILKTIDARVPPGDAQLDLADQEIRAARTALSAIAPPPSIAATHDLLRQSCELAASAVAAARRTSPGTDQSWSAAAAAAGALMLIDRARGNLEIPN